MRFTFLLLLLVITSGFAFSDAFAQKIIQDDSTGRDCTSIGIWESSTKTCTLTTDLNEEITIYGNGITLDGNNHSLTGEFYDWHGGSGPAGVGINGGSGNTVKNFIINGFLNGISITGDNNIVMHNISDLAFSGFSISGQGPLGGHNIIKENTFTNTAFWSFQLVNTNTNQIYDNNFINNDKKGMISNVYDNILNLDSPNGGNYYKDVDGPHYLDCTSTDGTDYCSSGVMVFGVDVNGDAVMDVRPRATEFTWTPPTTIPPPKIDTCFNRSGYLTPSWDTDPNTSSRVVTFQGKLSPMENGVCMTLNDDYFLPNKSVTILAEKGTVIGAGNEQKTITAITNSDGQEKYGFEIDFPFNDASDEGPWKVMFDFAGDSEYNPTDDNYAPHFSIDVPAVPVTSPFTITDDSTGGDCPSIGTWSSASKTCTLNKDVTITIDGFGIYITGQSGITIDGAGHTITGNGASGIDNVGVNITGQSSDITIKNLSITNFKMGIASYTTNGLTITDNTISNNGHHAIHGNGNDSVLIEDNNLNSNGSVSTGNGIDLDGGNSNYGMGNGSCSGTGSVVVKSNQITDTQNWGMALNTIDGVCVEGNTITSSGGGISVGGDNNKIIGNIVTQSDGYGIKINQAHGNTIQNNVITAGTGLMASNSNSGTLDGNTFSNNAGSAIYLNGANSYDVTGNTIESNNSQGLQIDSGAGHTVTDNTIQFNGNSGIRLTGTNTMISDNILNSNNDEGILILSGYSYTSTGNVIKNNNISNNAKGISLSGNTNEIFNNNFISNTLQSEVLDSSSGNLFDKGSSIGGNYWNTFDESSEGCDNSTPFDDYCDSAFVFTLGQDNFPWVLQNGVSPSPLPDTIPPVVVTPNDMAIQATSNNPSPVTFSATATDDTDGTLTPACSHNSGDDFPVGITTVSCNATDAAGNNHSKSFTITVTYDEPTSEPANGPITIPISFQEISGISGGSWTSDMNDDVVTTQLTGILNHNSFDVKNVDATLTFFIDGGEFCVVTDRIDSLPKDSTGIFTWTCPVLGTPTSAEGVILSYDTVDPDPTPEPLTITITGGIQGLTLEVYADTWSGCDEQLHWFITRDSGNLYDVQRGSSTQEFLTNPEDSLSYDVEYDRSYRVDAEFCGLEANPFTRFAPESTPVPTPDTLPPVIVTPNQKAVDATDANGVSVPFSVSATDDTDGEVSVDCSHNSGDTFQVGTTRVTCNASDAAGNQSTKFFDVIVYENKELEINVDDVDAKSYGTEVDFKGTGASPSEIVKLVISSQYDSHVDSFSVFANSNGDFVETWFTDNSISSGDYTVTATSGDEQASKTFYLEIKDETPRIVDPIEVYVNSASYETGEIIEVTGQVRDLYSGTPVSVIVRNAAGDQITVSQITVSSDKKFNVDLVVDNLWKTTGIYTVAVQYGSENRSDSTSFWIDAGDDNSKCGAGTVFDPVSNSCVLDGTTNPPIPDSDLPFEVTIVPADGSGAPGCEETSNGCFIPDTAYVAVGGVVTMSNTDSAAHTFTAGTSGDGPTGQFDTGLIMAGQSFEYSPDTDGDIPYFCMVHPWMQGLIVVGEGGPVPTHTSLNVKTDSGSYHIGDKIKVTGTVKPSDGSPVIIQVTGPSGQLVMIDQFTPSSNGVFSKEYKVAGSLWKQTGTYTLKANVNHSTDSTNFSIKTGVPDDIPQTPQDKFTVSIPSGTAAPGCEENNRCFSPYNAAIKVGGTITWSNDDTAAHTVTAGNPGDGPTGHFDSSLLMAGGSFSHTFDEQGEFDYFCMVHPWQQGIITVDNSGTSHSQVPSKSDLKIFTNDKVYDIGQMVLLGVEIDDSDRTIQVALDVSDPRGNTIVSRTLSVDPDSSESIEFRISEDFRTGNYKVSATASVDGKTIKDSTHFKVKSQFNEFKIESVSITDQKGNPSTLQKGDVGFVKVKLDSKKNIATLVTVNIFDSKQTSIGIGSVKATLAAGESEIILSFNIPSKMSSGDSEIYVNAFSDWPSNGGIPQTPESKIMENIR